MSKHRLRVSIYTTQKQIILLPGAPPRVVLPPGALPLVPFPRQQAAPPLRGALLQPAAVHRLQVAQQLVLREARQLVLQALRVQALAVVVVVPLLVVVVAAPGVAPASAPLGAAGVAPPRALVVVADLPCLRRPCFRPCRLQHRCCPSRLGRSCLDLAGVVPN
jgi:hypothetical protein